MKITDILNLLILVVGLVVVLREIFRPRDVILTWQGPLRKAEPPCEYTVEIRNPQLSNGAVAAIKRSIERER